MKFENKAKMTWSVMCMVYDDEQAFYKNNFILTLPNLVAK